MSPTITDPISPDLKQVLRTLKLSRMLDTLPDRLTLAKQQNLSHQAFLELVLSDEATRRETQSAVQRAAKAGLDPGMRLETWDETAAVHYDRTLWNELASLWFLDGPHGALLLGPVGSGKTHLAAALGTSPSSAATEYSCSEPRPCSNASRPPDWTTPSKPKCAG